MRAYAVIVDGEHHVLSHVDGVPVTLLFQRKKDAEQWMKERRLERPGFVAKRVEVKL